MFSDYYGILVLLTIGGTIGLLKLRGIPMTRLNEAETAAWRLVRGIALIFPITGSVLLWFDVPRWGGESLFHWAFIPFGIFLWARCIALLRKGVEVA